MSEAADARSKSLIQFAMVGKTSLLTDRSPADLPPISLCRAIDASGINLLTNASISRLFVRPLQ
jgi:hypothetical protein